MGVIAVVTIFKLKWAGIADTPEQTLYFKPFELTDAAVRFSQRVVELDNDETISGAYVHLSRLPDSIYPEGMDILAWTKMGPEHATAVGYRTEAEART